MLVDLHSHSTESDGSLTPEELADLAATSGVGVLALTDHDTTAGHRRFRARARQVGVAPVCGVEVSCDWPDGNCHLLGLGVRDDHPPLEDALLHIRDGRGIRNRQIVAKLNALGYPIGLDEVNARAGGDVVARPHFAQVLVERGHVAHVQEAFDQLLARGAAAYVDRFRLEPEQAVTLITEAGGRAVIAHPPQLKRDLAGLEDLVRRLKPHGLWGIEAYFSGVADEQVAQYLEVAARHGLAVTGGSDFHGAVKPHVRLGHYRAGTPLPGPCPPELLS